MGHNKPNSPLEALETHIQKYWDHELNDIQILDRLKEKKLFDQEKYGLVPHNPLEYNVFKWVVIPWFQAKLDEYVSLNNSTKKCAQKHKILPHGPPDDIDEHPKNYQALNFKVMIDPEADYIKEAKQLYAPPDHPVFELVPLEFDHWARQYYTQIGNPPVTRHNVWEVYDQLVAKFRSNAPLVETFNLQSFHDDRDEFVGEVQQALGQTVGDTVDDLQPLRYDEDTGYMGGIRGGLGMDEEVQLADGVVCFSSDEESNDSDGSDVECTL
ncbi:hypothetical protein GYMLUDRAFT_243681 [Collybiopsis luxurians FD-317 M1]|uniref:Uncharacterized protein n=1 Tax=Collybiopsis luxurians FD-317 M1 TaxID=944289 RepID=A0A0D0BD04_9AGAR|nr:hypothetical protein GYMLUDRAFT_243681 [Collybiopsis luxurians FD-317 M1]